MPRGQGRKVKQASQMNPQFSGIFSKLMDNLYQTKKVVIDEDSLKEISNSVTYLHDQEQPDFLKHYVSQVQGLYDIPHKYKVNIRVLIPAAQASDKDRRLPPKSDHSITRVVGVFFSHEVFTFPQRMKLLGSKGVLIPRNSILKVTPDQAQLNYNDRDTYDRESYQGKGRKYPTSRYIVILDFISEDTEDHALEQKKELDKLGGSSDLISGLSNLLGLK